VRGAVFSSVIVSFTLTAAAPPARLSESQLEAIHIQRIQWLTQRASLPQLGVYRDFRAAFTQENVPFPELVKAAREAGDQIVFSAGAGGRAEGVLFLPIPAGDAGRMPIYGGAAENADAWRKVRGVFKQYPDEVLGIATDYDADAIAKWDRETSTHPITGIAFSDSPPPSVIPYGAAFRNTSTHILARELTETAVNDSLAHGHAYVAHDWLCDPTGFSFFVTNNLGVFDMGDQVPMGSLAGHTELQVLLPVRAKIKLIRNGAQVAARDDSKFSFEVQEPGVYRLEASLAVDGADRPWILSNPIYIGGTANLRLPNIDTAGVELRPAISYTNGAADDIDKHKLDLYLPKGAANAPVLFFVHGGSWRTGDRSLYAAFGYFFAQRGFAVAIPSYRLMPKYQHPAQMEDVAKAFAWVYRNAPDFGGDPKRMYVAGHSAGAHLVSLLTLDRSYLQEPGVPPDAIQGVISMSGVYDVRSTPAFVFDGDRATASPIEHVGPKMPPFLITYCQWDYFSLPKQARDFAAALKKSFNHTEVLYIPEESHISEMISAVQEGSPLSRAILEFLK
jgi:acetyl esterase/lipase